MERIQAGMAAISMAGHDEGQLYMILKAEGEYVFLADGRLRTIEKPKKKNVKHIQIMKKVLLADGDCETKNIKNEEIRRILKSLR